MFRFSISFHAVPRDEKGSFIVYASCVVYDDEGAPVRAFEIGEKIMSGMPDISTTTPVTEFAVEWADIFYQFATQIHAERKQADDSEVNARPSSASTN